MKTPIVLMCLILMACGNAKALSPPPAAAPAAPAAHVDSFTPQGYMRGVRQVQVRFSEDMVALGDPRLPDPFLIACGAAGHGRWADSRNWEYDFNADLDAGVSCRFTLKTTIKSLAGHALRGERHFDFNTGGPAIRNSLPADGWEELSEDQVFILKLDAAATAVSVGEHAWCAIEGVAERIPVQLIEGAEREAILVASRQLAYSYYELLWKDGRVSEARVRNHELARREALLAVLRCQRRLPPASQVSLHWGAGIATASGLRTQEDQQLAFRVRPDFTASVECTRTNPRAGCVPTLPVTVTFSAPVPRALALQVRVTAGGGVSMTASAPADAKAPSLQSVTFAGPFPQNQSVTVQLPKDLLDDSGRPLANAARFPLALRIDSAPPLVKFSGEFGILEAREGGVLPVTVRNVERRIAVQQSDLPARTLSVQSDAASIVAWLRRVQSAQSPQGEWVEAGDSTPEHPRRIWQETTGAQSVFGSDDVTRSFSIKGPRSSRPAEVIGIPLRKPGLYVVEIASPVLGAALLGSGKVRYVATVALVTDMAVHLQWGNEASSVWVTQLASGKPVAHAQVIVANACNGRPCGREAPTHRVSRASTRRWDPRPIVPTAVAGRPA